MIIIIIILAVLFVAGVVFQCIRMKSMGNTSEDHDYYNNGLTLNHLLKFHKKHNIVATINDGKILWLAKERED